jgi:hypothetical protein
MELEPRAQIFKPCTAAFWSAIMRDEILTEDQQSMKLLAYYDARRVPDTKLVAIFRTTAADLTEVRQDEEYKQFLADELGALEAQAAETDDSWDALERQAVSDLRATMDSLADPRMLLGIAVQANKATRKNAVQRGLAQPGVKNGQPVDVGALTGPSKVIRIRTNIMQKLTQANGASMMVERQVEVTQQANGTVDEALSPSDVKELLQSALNINTGQMRILNRFGSITQTVEGLDFTNLEDGAHGV